MLNKVLIVCSETKLDLSIFNNERHFIIGVERGCLDLMHKKIKLDLAIADFDNVTKQELELIKSHATLTKVLHPEKDLLDGEAAILHALDISEQADIVFVANPSKRYDMNFSALNLVNKYNLKFINDETLMLRLPKGQTQLKFSEFEHFTYISFFATTTCHITLSQFKYNTVHMRLDPFENNCISNAFVLNQNPIIDVDKSVILIASK